MGPSGLYLAKPPPLGLPFAHQPMQVETPFFERNVAVALAKGVESAPVILPRRAGFL